MQFSLAGRIATLTLVLTVTTALGTSIYLLIQVVERRNRDLLNHGAVLAAMTAMTAMTAMNSMAESSDGSALGEDEAALGTLLESLPADSDVAYAAVMDDRGGVVAQRLGDSLDSLPEVAGHSLLAPGRDVVLARYIDRTTGARYFDVVVPVRSSAAPDRGDASQAQNPAFAGRGARGYLRLGLRQAALRRDAAELVVAAAPFFLTLVVVGAFVTVLAARRLTLPLRRLAGVGRDISQGNLERWVEVQGRGEMRALSRDLHLMTERLRAVTNEVSSYREKGDLEEEIRSLQTAREDALSVAEEAVAANRAKSQFLANMNHEIRTPLNALIGLTELLLGTHLTSRQRRYAKMSQESAETLLGIVNDILDLSKIEAGKLVLESVDFDLHDVVHRAIKLLAGQAHGKGIEMAFWVDSELPSGLRGDPGCLGQVLINLLSNAVKFTHQGEIVLRVKHQEEAGDALVLRFEVTDTGIGIADDEHLFEPFTQADSPTSDPTGGTGLGLAICRQLAQKMGGQIGVDSNSGVGSTFWFTVCLERQRPDPRTEPRRELEGLRVLIVEDNDTSRAILEHHAREWKMGVSSAAGGAAVLDLLASVSPQGKLWDLVVVDLHMPGLDGLEVCRRMRIHPALADAKLLLLTHMDDDDAREQSPHSGVAAYLTKPVAPGELYDGLVATLGKPQVACARSQDPPAPSRGAGKRSGVRVLVVEDNLVNQQLAADIIAMQGYDADVANNGIEAIAAFSRNSYNAVIMDCQMPELDGFAATARIRDMEKKAGTHTPIIGFTGNAIKTEEKKCRDSGMDDFIAKPITVEKFAAVLKRWIEGGELGEA